MRDELVQRLGLERDPFPEQPDGLMLLTPGLAQRIALLAQLLKSTTRPVLVVAPHGGGVSTWLDEALNSLGSPLRCVHWRATKLATSRDLLQSLARSLDAEEHPEDVEPAVLADSVRAQLVRFQAANAVPVLLVEDAHHLPQTALETLLELGDTPAGWLRVVFAGEPSVEARLLKSRTDRDPAWLPRIELAPLSSSETREYVNFRLREAGWQGELPFDEATLAAIEEVAGGLPGRINECARDAMEARWPGRRATAWLDRLRQLPLPSPVLAGSALAILAAVALTWLLWPESSSDPGAPIATFELPGSVLQAPPEATASAEPAATRPAPGTERVQGLTPSAPASRPGTVAPSVPAAVPLPSAPSPEPSALPPPSAAASATEAPTAGATVAQPAPVATPEGSPQAARADIPPRPLAPPRERTRPVAVATAPPVAPAPPPPRATAGTPPTPKAVPPLNVGAAGKWGIQLEAFGDVIAARAYAERVGIGRRGGIYRVTRETGSPVFAVILGQFESRQAAATAIVDLPLALRAAGPFPRALAGLASIN